MFRHKCKNWRYWTLTNDTSVLLRTCKKCGKVQQWKYVMSQYAWVTQIEYKENYVIQSLINESEV